MPGIRESRKALSGRSAQSIPTFRFMQRHPINSSRLGWDFREDLQKEKSDGQGFQIIQIPAGLTKRGNQGISRSFRRPRPKELIQKYPLPYCQTDVGIFPSVSPRWLQIVQEVFFVLELTGLAW